MPRKLDHMAKLFNKGHQAVFHRTNGRFGGSLMGIDVVALTTIGRKTGERRTVMVGAPIIEDELVVVIASYAAGPVNPQWYYNLLADPHVEVVIRGNTHVLLAREAEGDERAAIWQRMITAHPSIEKYQEKAGERRIPLIMCEPAA